MLIVVACVAVAFVLMLAGVLPVVRANRRLQSSLEKVQSAQLLALDPKRLENAVTRIQSNVEAVPALSTRAGVALATIQQGLRDLRVPEALLALRAAGTAIRALASLHSAP